jgi:signal transduction histidine kinase
LVNLLSNAIKYSPLNKQIKIWIGKESDAVVLKVEDQGIGIDNKDVDKVFDRFYRAAGENEKTYPGFGIGLFLAREIIERHHGSIFVESQKGKGSIFTIKLPMDRIRKTVQ